MNKYLSVITLNVNGLNVPIKRHKVGEWIRKHDPHIYCLQRGPSDNKRSTQTESEVLEENIPSNRTRKNASITIVISDKMDLKTKAIKTDKEGHFIILKESLFQEAINMNPT